MARAIRIQFPGALYHVMSRGNRRQNIFLSDRDRVLFLQILGETTKSYNLVCHSYCLMDNHFHLLIETPEANLSDAMRRLNSNYAQKFNRLNGCDGHVLQGRYKSILVEKDSYLLEVSRYIVLNPVRAGLVSDPAHWPWSSYSQTVGYVECMSLLTTDYTLAQFMYEGSSREAFSKYVMSGIGSHDPFSDMKDPFVLGSDEYIGKVWKEAGETKQFLYASRDSRFIDRPSLSELFACCSNKEMRNSLISVARNELGYTMSEIAEEVGLHRTSVSEIVKKT